VTDLKKPRYRIVVALGLLLIVVGIGPLAYLLWFRSAHNFQPLSMQVPLKQGEYTSPVFKTDLDEPYMIQMGFADSSQRGIGLNRNAVLDLDWKIIDANGTVIQQGTQNTRLSWANSVNLGEYHPKRGLAQRLNIDLHHDIDEPEGSHVTLEVNSTEDPEGMAFGSYMFLGWAFIVAGLGVILLAFLLIRRPAR
jgi:hypothetical protein